jgi:hypothetical protein
MQGLTIRQYLIGKKAAAKMIKFLRTQQMERRLKELAKKSKKRQDFTRSLLDKIMKTKLTTVPIQNKLD